MEFTEQQVSQALIKYNDSEDYHFWKDSNNVFRMLNNKLAHDLGYKSTDISFDSITDYDHSCRIVELTDDFVCRDKHVLSKPKKTVYQASYTFVKEMDEYTLTARETETLFYIIRGIVDAKKTFLIKPRKNTYLA